MTKRKITKVDSNSVKESFDDRVRQAEAALLRIADGVSEPGDVARIRDVGWNSPDDHRVQLERLRGVRRALEAVGSADDLRKSRQRYEAAEAAATKSVPVIDGDIEKLQKQIEVLRSDRDKLTGELSESKADLDTRMKELARLRSPALLPAHVNDELNARRRSVNSASATRQAELTELISKLRADGGRLRTQSNADGSVQNWEQLEAYAQRAAADDQHRAHQFWRDRVFSLPEWQNFDAWCQRTAEQLTEELDGIKAANVSAMVDEAEELASFYTSDIE